MPTITAIFASIISGIMLSASFPPFDLHFLAWIALVPLLFSLTGKSPKYAFALSLVSGAIFIAMIFDWILEVPGYTLLHHALLVGYLGSHIAVFGLTFSFICRRRGVTASLFAAPFLWVSLEYIRSNMSFLALPWGLVAHSQYQHPAVMQVASVTGTYGLSFLIVLVNSAIVAMIYLVFWRFKGQNIVRDELYSTRGKGPLIVAAALLTAIALFYGKLVTSKPITGQAIRVSLVQGNIEQPKKWDRKYANFIMQTYSALTEKVSRDEPAFIVWPETATPGAIKRNPLLYGQVRRIAKTAGTHLMLGSAQGQKLRGKEPEDIEYMNSVFLIPPNTRIMRNQRYDKIHLLPFGEYLPLKETVPWSYIEIPDLSVFKPGKRFTVFKLSGLRFSVTICWENIFPNLVRQFVKRGAQFVVNLTNEAWFGKTAAPYQFMSMSVFRAVENRRYVVRCTNTGISCFIDPYGRIVDRIKDENGQDVFVRGVLTGSIIPLESKTIYTRYGDWLALLCFPFSAVFLLFAIFGKK